MCALFLVVAGARFWLIRHYAVAMPFWDQWDAEGMALLKPWLEGTLHWGALFAPHNEHRIVLTRLLVLALCAANGQWDCQVEMAANAVFCGLCAVGVAGAVWSAFCGRFPRILLLAVGLYFVLPFGWENTLCGFQSQNDFLNFFSLLAVWGLGVRRAGTAGWWAGAVGAVLACLSMASGFLAAAAVLGLIGLRSAQERRHPHRSEVVTTVLCAGIVVAGWTTRTEVPGHAVLKAESLTAFLRATGRFLAWPWCEKPVLGFLAVIPPVVLTVVYLRNQPPRGEDNPRNELLLAASGWAILQTAAIAYGRGGQGALPACRYMDALALVTLVNFFIWLALPDQLRDKGWRVVTMLGAAVWTMILVSGLKRETERDFQGWMPGFHHQLLQGEENARRYVATHDFGRFLAGKPPGELPYPVPERLAMVLDDPTLRRVLPADLRPALTWRVTAENGPAAFVQGAYDPICGVPEINPVFGSYFEKNARAVGSFRADLAAPAALPYLRFAFAGDLGEPGLAFTLSGATGGRRVSWHPKSAPHHRWRLDDLPNPGGTLRLEATDGSGTRWFAFSAPVEVGAWSRWTGFLLRRGGLLLLAGVLLAGGAEGWSVFARRRLCPRQPRGELPINAGELRPATPLTLLSVVIPARDEAQCLAATVEDLHAALKRADVPHEILVVDDGSTDGTNLVLQALHRRFPEVKPLLNPGPNGFGRAITFGLERMRGDAAVILMADASDDPQDVVRYWRVLQEGYDCVFGSRFLRGSRVENYPWFKLVANRAANLFIQGLFRVACNDVTNAFKAYRREVIAGCRPLIAPHFNLTVELPLKAMVRGYRWKVVPITWRNRRAGATKFRLKEMGSRYLFVCLYVWLEKHLSRGDYHRETS